MILNEEFQIHDELNPKLWDEDQKLKEEVKNKIIEIVSEFEDYIDYPIDIVDIQLVGSNASYNYTDNSDLDVHIIANFEETSNEPELLKMLYDAKKSSFNKEYDISIHGVEIEMYIQDIQSGITSNGIYSICDDDWIKKPKKITSVKTFDLSKEIENWKAKIKDVLDSKDSKKIEEVIDMLYLIRHNSIAVDGEWGKGNQLYKELRNLGLVQALKDAKLEAKSNELTLENLTSGQLVNKLNY